MKTTSSQRSLRESGRRELHVSPLGDDSSDGDPSSPLLTISAAATLAEPGDVVTVHAGTYRERIDPLRGGTGDNRRIVYRAAPGDEVVVKGSELVTGWRQVEGDLWTVRVPNSLFGEDNPYADELTGHWFDDKGRKHHRGAVYLNGHWLTEAAAFTDMTPIIREDPLWFGEAGESFTTLWAQFDRADPNGELVEINVRSCVFYPSRKGIDYLTVRGLTLCHGATPWSPPTTEQIGLIGTNWSRGWVIEDNTVSYSVCAGITLGKYHDPEDDPADADVSGAVGANMYNVTIARALESGWNVDLIGGHIVRRNHIMHCEQAGICGSLGPVRCIITENTIHDIHVRQLFAGAEQAGIKFHGAIDTEISRNRIYRCYRGIWLDWMNQGTRVTRNLCYENGDAHDLFMEVNHGPYLIDHNLFLSPKSLDNWSHGGAYAHNLFLGAVSGRSELGRETPWLVPHSTELGRTRSVEQGDDRLVNNIFVESQGLSAYDEAPLPITAEDNLYLAGAIPAKREVEPEARVDNAPIPEVEGRGDEVYLHLHLDLGNLRNGNRTLVTSERLGRTALSDLPFEGVDGSSLVLDTDYFGDPHDPDDPAPGPFAATDDASDPIKVWPVRRCAR